MTGVTDSEGMIWQSYRYNANGDMTFGKPQYNNVYSYNAESYNPNMESQYLRARYYNVMHGNFLTEDSYLGNIIDPLTLNQYNYVKSSPLNYIDPSGHVPSTTPDSLVSSNWVGYSSVDEENSNTANSTSNSGISTSDPVRQLEVSMELSKIYTDNSQLRKSIEDLMQGIESGRLKVVSFCEDVHSGYRTGVYRAEVIVNNLIVDVVTFGNGYWSRAYVSDNDIYIFIYMMRKQKLRMKLHLILVIM